MRIEECANLLLVAETWLQRTLLLAHKYAEAVNKGQYPTHPEVIRLSAMVDYDKNNKNLFHPLEAKFKSGAVIGSSKGTVRANHYHEASHHYAYALSGRIEYYWRPLGSTALPQHAAFYPGDVFFSPPRTEHSLYFYENTKYITFSQKLPKYDRIEDTVRLPHIPLFTENPKEVRGNES